MSVRFDLPVNPESGHSRQSDWLLYKRGSNLQKCIHILYADIEIAAMLGQQKKLLDRQTIRASKREVKCFSPSRARIKD